MPRPARPWFRVYVEMFPDRKLRRLTPAQRWIWCALMGLARESPDDSGLFVAENEPVTHDDIASYADVKLREVAPAIAAMTKLGMVAVTDDGVISLPNFGHRQYESDNSTKRVQAHRERSNTAGSNDVGTLQPRSQKQDRNGPETETETETEQQTSSVVPRKRGTRITEDWKPTPADIDWARSKHIDDLTQRRQTERFVNHFLAATGQTATKLDWSRAWRNWLDRDAERRTPPPRQAEGMPW